MTRFIVRRLFWGTVLFLTSIAFVMYYVMPPVSPAVLFAGKEATPNQIAMVPRPRPQPSGVDPTPLLLKHLVFGDKYGWPGLGLPTSTVSVKSLIGPRITSPPPWPSVPARLARHRTPGRRRLGSRKGTRWTAVTWEPGSYSRHRCFGSAWSCSGCSGTNWASPQGPDTTRPASTASSPGSRT